MSLFDLYPEPRQIDPLSPIALEMRGFRVKPGTTDDETLVQLEGGQYMRIVDAVRSGVLTATSKPFQLYDTQIPIKYRNTP